MKAAVVLVMTFVLAFAGLGCKGSGGGGSNSTPEGVGQAFVAAVNAGDKAAIAALYPTDDAINAAVECSGENELLKRIAQNRERMQRELDGDLKGMTMEWVGIDTSKASEAQTMAVGSERDGCKAKVAITMQRFRFKFKMSKEGRTEEESEGVQLVQFGEGQPWYIFRF